MTKALYSRFKELNTSLSGLQSDWFCDSGWVGLGWDLDKTSLAVSFLMWSKPVLESEHQLCVRVSSLCAEIEDSAHNLHKRKALWGCNHPEFQTEYPCLNVSGSIMITVVMLMSTMRTVMVAWIMRERDVVADRRIWYQIRSYHIISWYLCDTVTVFSFSYDQYIVSDAALSKLPTTRP